MKPVKPGAALTARTSRALFGKLIGGACELNVWALSA